MVNVQLLRIKLIEKDITVSELATLIEVDRSTLYRKIRRNGEPITIKEIDSIIKVLGLTKNEAIAIFLAQYVT